MRRLPLLMLAVLLLPSALRAEVTRVDIARRVDLGLSGYEKIVGTIYFAVDPKDPRNQTIADIDKAPVNAAGRVEFSSDLYILKPKAPRGNGAALLDVLNRGNKIALNGFNRGAPPDPANDSELGDRFLMRFGYTLVWVGWEFDVPDRPMTMRIRVPAATEAGKPIAGVVRARWTANARGNEYAVNDLASYRAIDPGGADSRLVVCPEVVSVSCVEIPRADWRVSGHTVTFDRGFEPGKTYEVAYRAANPPIAGLGFAAIRDTASWLKHQSDAVATVRYVYGFGSSQSGRFLRSFLYEGFNTDEKNRQVLDAAFVHIAGASRLDLNSRWSKPVAVGLYDATSYPFADTSVDDPVSGAREGLLANPRVGAHAPKIFYTNTPVEYWGGGRVAALVHTDAAGGADLPLPPNVRAYFIAGTQHSPSRFPPSVDNGQHEDNAVDYWWAMRALLLAMHKWVKEGVEPPPSMYPRLQDRTLVPAAAVALPAIPGVASPRALTGGTRIANRFLRAAVAGAKLPLLVPDVDADGNERAGIRLPQIAVPLATYTGWNFRKPEIGSPGELVPLAGSTIPFPATRAEREKTNDPRRSIEERYRSQDDYLAEVQKVLDDLVIKGYLVYDDGPRILQRATDEWDLFVTERSPGSKR